MSGFITIVKGMRGSGKLFSLVEPVMISRAPGRLNVIGGNVDHTGGLLCEATIRAATWAAAQLRPVEKTVLLNPQLNMLGWTENVDVSMEQIAEVTAVRALANSESGLRWTAYVLGVFHLLRRRWPLS